MNASQAPELNPGHAVVDPGPAVVASGGASVTLKVRRVSMDTTPKSRDEDPVDEDRSSLFVISHGLTTPEAEELLRSWGRNELVEKATPMWWIILRQVMFERIL